VSLELDHVIMAVADLGAAATELDARYGLPSVDGGRHPGWGTANRIVPLGDAYLELIAVVDEEEARDNAFGRWTMERRAHGGRLLGWAVRTWTLDEVAGQLGLAMAAGSRRGPDGRLLRWRYAGTDEALVEPSLPFFIEWAQGTPFPGRAAAAPFEATELRLEGDPARLAGWLGPHTLPVTIEPGSPRVKGLVLRGPAGEVLLSGGGS
jgi:Glyoxalase-like domain